MSWAWRKVLQLRHIIRKFIWHKIGDGQRTSIWYDHWCHLSPLAEVVSYRDIHRAGLLPSSKVADVMVSGSLVWPIDLSSKLYGIQFRPHDNKVDWVYVVWFSPGCIPRHSFSPMLVVKKKLKTQERMATGMYNASLLLLHVMSSSQPDSLIIFFFEFPFSNQVWCHMRDLFGITSDAAVFGIDC
ncbi:hypothetical protein Tco_0765043 [Tanacetum coccineum]